MVDGTAIVTAFAGVACEGRKGRSGAREKELTTLPRVTPPPGRAPTVAEAPVGTDPGTFVALGGGDVAIVERGGGSARCNTRRALNASLVDANRRFVIKPDDRSASRSAPGM